MVNEQGVEGHIGWPGLEQRVALCFQSVEVEVDQVVQAPIAGGGDASGVKMGQLRLWVKQEQRDCWWFQQVWGFRGLWWR